MVVQSPKGGPYWTWQGPGARVRLGGGQLDAAKNSEGATLARKMVWFVFGFDAEGTVVASSARRKISP